MRLPHRAAILAFSFVLLSNGLHAQDAAPPSPPAGGVVLRTEGACEGYTLFSPLRSTSTYLIDLDGEVVHEWASEHNPGNAVYLLENGHLLRTCRVPDNRVFRGGGSGGRIQEMDRDGSVLWDYPVSSESELQHHDVEPLPNGNVLVIAWEAKTREEAIAAGRAPERTHEAGIWPDKIVELRPIRPDGAEVVWEWHAWDHLIQDHDPEAAGFGDVTAHPQRIDINADHRREPPMTEAERRRREELLERMRELGYVGDEEEEDEEDETRGDPRRGRGRQSPEWLHTNSVDHHAGLDLVLLSVHSLNEIWVIDHSTTTEEAAGSEGGRFGRGGDLLYRWGNPRTYGAGGREDQRFFRQHDAQWVVTDAADELRVTVFNNGEGRPGERFSSVEEIVLPFDPEEGFVREEGEAFGPTEPVWIHGSPEQLFFSSFISGAHRLPNGNTLICSGAESRVFEVTAEGEIVWDYVCPFSSGPRDGRQGRRRPGEPADGRGPGASPGGGRGGERRPGPPPGRPDRGRAGPGGPPGLFRATRIPVDCPGLEALGLEGDS